ncbi:dUTP diphosphatase [Saccharicrinis aurantiacus]|uniref:dUTP diphosphatase n=1 Tax=Saccharicrinis aurantiacus TaxID=1849719 RepID=UPI002491A519|nr:dUTP diphosphatase [Saccharicrinis aurantiacus]
MAVKINIINKSTNNIPEYATPHSAGVDLRAFITEDIIIKPLERVIIPTGLFIELPEGYEAQIRPRSGLAAKFGITVLNTPGTIDADYRGEIKVILVNLSNEAFVVKNSERICQMVIKEYVHAQFFVVEELNDSVRGEGGFGHTGKN